MCILLVRKCATLTKGMFFISLYPSRLSYTQVSQLFESTQSGRGEWASVSNTLSIRVRRDRILEDSFDMLCHVRALVSKIWGRARGIPFN